MARKEVDIHLKEVGYINCYAFFMAYLLMAIRGLGYLVITWSTVVLLGGFVSDLGKKDFWSLTIITLVLTPRVCADVGLKEKLMDIWYSFHGLYRTIFATLDTKNSITLAYWPRGLLAVVVWLCHLLVAPIVVGPLAALYVCGPLLSAGISVWRLIEHDYGDVMKEEGCCNCMKDEDSHLQPALNVLYTLALLQGLLFCYRCCHFPFSFYKGIFCAVNSCTDVIETTLKKNPILCCRFYASFARKRLVRDVAKEYNMSNDEQLVKAVKKYLSETVSRCEKDPAFFKETNLATYAVGMIKSIESLESFVSGARILDVLLNYALTVKDKRPRRLTEEKQKALTTDLIGLASTSHVVKKLLQAMDSTSPHGVAMRGIAANILANIAGRTPLMQFSQVIQSVGSLIDISQQQLEGECAVAKLQSGLQEAENYRKLLMEKGFDILHKLAADQENCRAISNSQGLRSKAVAPVRSDLLHLMDHEAWSTTIVDKSLQVMASLVASPGETGAQLRNQISSDKEVIHGMERILRCCGCSEHVRILSIEILTHLAMDEEESLRVNKESRENFIRMLPSILTDDAKECSIRELAGEALVMLSQSKSDAAIILKANDHVVRDLTKIL
ncbi:unnamed protein product [Triticum turgidum subsp. durum]|uniref:Uncharacterized protein n=1 Tax=Triticum turgidum subsp. durum TaxID=4567 RepID=A0A9R1BVF3_TRITD|nr:unnamed protein product [Triticum turgidum subsp. durum]